MIEALFEVILYLLKMLFDFLMSILEALLDPRHRLGRLLWWLLAVAVWLLFEAFNPPPLNTSQWIAGVLSVWIITEILIGTLIARRGKSFWL